MLEWLFYRWKELFTGSGKFKCKSGQITRDDSGVLISSITTLDTFVPNCKNVEKLKVADRRKISLAGHIAGQDI